MVTYQFDIWLLAEKHFPSVAKLQDTNQSGKYPVKDDMYLLSNVFGDNDKRYTGIHAFFLNGGIVPNSGVNLDEPEWKTLLSNFQLFKDFIKGKKVEGSQIKHYEQPERETCKMYIAEWVLDGDTLKCSYPTTPTFSKEAAELYGKLKAPVAGKDYDVENGEPELRVRAVRNVPPTDLQIMYTVLLEAVQQSLNVVLKRGCEACAVQSEIKDDHQEMGNCLETDPDFLKDCIAKAMLDIPVVVLVTIFSKVRSAIGLKPVFAKQLADAALAWNSAEKLQHHLSDATWSEGALRQLVQEITEDI